MIDCSFGLDIVLTFFSAIEDEDLKVIDDRMIIFKNYIFGQFIIDFLSVFPFDLLLESNYNQLVRFARIGRLYRLASLTKI